MKNKLQIVLMLLVIASCTKKEEDIQQEDLVQMRLSAVIESEEDTRTILNGKPSDSYRNTYWLPSDSIAVTNGTIISKFVNISTTSAATATFEGKFLPSSSTCYASYPFSTSTTFSSSSFGITLPGTQTYYKNGISSDSAPMVAKREGTTLNFKNLCGILVLQLTGTDTVASISFSGTDSGGKPIPVSGRGTVSMTYSSTPELVMDSGAETMVELKCPGGVILNSTTPTTFHIVLPPATYNNFSIAITDTKGKAMYLDGTKSLTVKRAERITAKSIDFVPNIIDLSASGTANCYIVARDKKYKFKATVKGNSTESVGTPATAEVLWKSFGNDMVPQDDNIVKNVRYSNGYVVFDVTNSGNAVIAVKDASGTILWSWHIWSGNEPIGQVYSGGGTMMDRNLGALQPNPSIHNRYGSYGLLYQWGRKDPFLNKGSDEGRAASTITWPVVSGEKTVDYAIQHPTTYVYVNGDWTNQNDSLWCSKKTMYDPCPVGWRVPDGGEHSFWEKSFFFGYHQADTSEAYCYYGAHLKEFVIKKNPLASGGCWYPFSQLIFDEEGRPGYFYGGYYATCTVSGTSSWCVYVYYYGNHGEMYYIVSQRNDIVRAAACSVRCAKDE